jgi:hypothetical protein
MLAQDTSERIGLVVALDTLPTERGLRLTVTPAEETRRIVALRSSVALSLWRESPGVVRGAIGFGPNASAYFQGTDALLDLALALGLAVESEA